MNFGKKSDPTFSKHNRHPNQNSDATDFLCDEIPEAVQAEIKPILKGWRNRRTLRFISLEDVYGSSKKDYARAYLTYVLERQGSSEWQESCAAAWALGVIPLDANERKEACRVLRLALGDHVRSFKDYTRIMLSRTATRALPISFVLMSILVAYGFYAQGQENGFMSISIFVLFFGIPILALVLSPPILLLTLGSDLKRKLHIQSFSAISLGRLGMTESIGVLAKATNHMDKQICRASLQALVKILPAVDASCYASLPDDAVYHLCKLLGRLIKSEKSRMPFASESSPISEVQNEENVLVILTALEFIGDSSAIVAARDAAKNGMTEAVRTKAENLLPILEERGRLETDKKMLLRGSSEPIVSNTLLRPATYSAPESSGQLLRASVGGESEIL